MSRWSASRGAATLDGDPLLAYVRDCRGGRHTAIERFDRHVPKAIEGILALAAAADSPRGDERPNA